MTDQIDPTTAAVQAAQQRRLVEASACDARYKDKLATGQSPSQAHQQYLAEGRAIDAEFERTVEPWRQHFLAANPGEPLPAFLTPGFKSFAVRQQRVVAPPQTVEKHQEKKNPLWWMPLVGAGIVGLFILGGCVSMVVNSSKTKDHTSISALTPCEDAMRIASLEPDSTKADPLIATTLSTCSSKAEWVAALTKFPAAMGVTYVTDGKLEHQAACSSSQRLRACQG